VEGLPLREIGPEAFKDSAEICYLLIPENVRVIHDGALAGCTNLREVVLPDSLEYCSAKAFTDTTGFTIVSHENTRGSVLAAEIGAEWQEGSSLSVD